MTENEVDILSIDRKIIEFYEKELEKIPQHKERLAELEKTLASDKIPYRTRGELERNIKELTDTITNIESKRDLNFYISETAEYLQKYREKLKTPVKVSFMCKKPPEDKEKTKIINDYLEVAQKYYNISKIKSTEKKSSMSCNNCSNKKDFVIDESVYICEKCGSEQDLSIQTTSYKDSDRVNISAKYTYDRKVHFRDCMNQYQGKQNCTIEQKVYDDLEDIFERHHLLVGDKNTKKEIRFSKITRTHVVMFLKELGYSKHYENAILIHYNMTGKKPDDISHLEDALMADLDLLLETYDKLYKNKVDRVNFISTQFVLYQLLQRHKHPCKKEDFVILKTIDRKSFHEDICQHLFSILGWNCVNI